MAQRHCLPPLSPERKTPAFELEDRYGSIHRYIACNNDKLAREDLGLLAD